MTAGGLIYFYTPDFGILQNHKTGKREELFMKKMLATAAAAVLLVSSLTFGAAAATVDIVPNAEFSNVDSKSDNWQYEKNADTQYDLYVRNQAGDQEIVFKADGKITGFTVGLQMCAGFFEEGNANRDVKFYVSADKSDWEEVGVTQGATTFREDIYFLENLAYWFETDVTSKSISGTPSYLKIVIKDSPVNGAPSWNMAIDSVKLEVEPTSSGGNDNNNDNNGDGDKDNNNSGSSGGSNNGGSSSPATGENSAAASVAVLSVMSLGVLLTVKAKKAK